jgi:CoA-transferase family III
VDLRETANSILGPLAGINLLDLASVVSGLVATVLLADQGAEVIKIEPLGTDITRDSRQSTSCFGRILSPVRLDEPKQAILVARSQAARSADDHAHADRPRATYWCRIFGPARWSGSASVKRQCAAPCSRERSGEGQHIRLATLDTIIACLWPEAMNQYTVVEREASPTDPPQLILETVMATLPSAPYPFPSGGAIVPRRSDWISPRIPTSAPSGRAGSTDRILLMGGIIRELSTMEWLSCSTRTTWRQRRCCSAARSPPTRRFSRPN